ncbi:MAG: PxKF domain-containing protein [Actinomycetota bacterium]|nr:PxKF domain-containing protein [Actinomycetota bacterium]
MVRLDTQVPTITGSRSPAQPASGWNNTPVDVTFTCDDPNQGVTKDNAGFASGIKTCPGKQTVSDDGANQSVTAKAVDLADNEASTTVGGINIDRTPPVVTGAATTAPNGDGWYKSDVSIAWACSDPLSGLAGTCPGNSTISGEGSNLGATSPSVSDKAGNSRSGSVTGINIDRKVPNTSAIAPATDWNNTDVTVVLDADDALSGVKATHYKVNGGTQQTGTSVSFSSEGTHTLEYWSVDKAGNVEATKTVQLKIDKTKPSINHTQSPVANDNGWNNTNVKVTFVCKDDGGSGIKSCTGPVTVETEGKNQPVNGTAVDNAGNTATDPATVSIDKTAPAITAAADRDANAAGWYKDDVTVSFTCSDALSGIVAGAAGCTPAKTLSQGADQSANGTATDAAGNTASATKTDINIDKTVPTLTGAAQGAPTNGWYKGDVTVVWSCSDALSGIDGTCPANSTITGEGSALAAGASVSDKAGNSASATVSGIRIDRTASTTRAGVPGAKYGPWHAGSVEVALESSDNLSGVDKIHYTVNGGPVQDYASPFSLGTTGTHTINFWSVDKAGNAEDKSAASQTITIQIDNTQPSIEGSRSPANGFGWNNGPVTVSFKCNDLESGLAGCAPTSETLGDEGEGQSVTGVATDNVGNSKSLTVGGINIDITKPRLSGSPTTPANGAGWYKGNVTVKWTGTDGLSGIDPATQPADSVVTGEGANLSAGPVSISDKAGNSESASVSNIKIDRTAPVIDGKPTTAANGAGWYKDAVTVGFACTDNLSGVASCPSSKVVSTDGANQSVTSDKASDNAGNEAAGKTVGGINVDGSAPKTDADIVCTGKNGWCRGTTATVNLTAADQAGLSGVKGIHYKLNNGNWVFAQGASKEVVVPLAGNGTATLLFYGEDSAGNLETQNGVALKYDTIAPTVTHTLSPGANAALWNNSDVTVSFQANDDSDGSGVDTDTVTKPVTISTETEGQVVKGEAYDKAGNHGTDSVTVKLDKTAPTITGAATTSPNAAGWYRGSVTIKFTCSDALSGIASCPADVTLTANGQGQSATGTATDRAGNQASATVANINIDTSAPTITVTGVAPGAIYTLGSVPTGGCTAEDIGPSGLDGSCQFTVTGGTSTGVSTFNYTATAKDVAGNVTTVSGTYTVRYPVVTYSTSFWLQPINDTAHTKDATTSVFKAGSTIPAKFRIVGADGKAIQTATPPQWITPVKGSATTAAVDESVYSDPATSGSNFTWNATEQLYQFNWASPKNGNGYFWRIGVKLDDGTTQAVHIGLR